MSIIDFDMSGLVSFDSPDPLAGAAYYLQDPADRPTLLAFSLVCQSFRDAALPLLFRTLCITLTPWRNPARHLKSLVAFVATHQPIARRITELALVGAPGGHGAACTRVQLSDVGKLVAQLPALRTLALGRVWLSHDVQTEAARRSGLGHAHLGELYLEGIGAPVRPVDLYHLFVGGAFASMERVCVRGLGQLVGVDETGAEPTVPASHQLRTGVLWLRDVDWRMVGWLWAITQPSALNVECRTMSDAESLGWWLGRPRIGEQVRDLTVDFSAGLREHAANGLGQRIDASVMNISKCTQLLSLRVVIYMSVSEAVGSDTNERAWALLCSLLSQAPPHLKGLTIELVADGALTNVLPGLPWTTLGYKLNELPSLAYVWFLKSGCDGCTEEEEAIITGELWEVYPRLIFPK